VEKFLKAYLIFKDVDFGRTHDLKLILNLCRNVDEDFKGIEVGRLTFYAVQVKYPDDFYIPTIDEAQECKKIAASVMDFILKKLNIDINSLS
jgi:HEPN domain-containing protein